MKKGFFCFPKNKWFFEDWTQVPYDNSETVIGTKYKKKLYEGKSKYQQIAFYDTKDYGKVLLLDGILQTTENDEFIYHEILCHVPMLLHPNPEKVLVVGGGDGGSLEELLKHPIKEAWMVDIDGKVVKLCQKYLPSISKNAFQDKRTHLIIGDGQKIIKRLENYFDVIILDLSDPRGPAKKLISTNFYQNVKKALTKNGLVSIQSGSFDCQPELINTIYNRIKKVFPFIEIRKAMVPSYQAGEYGFTVGLKLNPQKTTQANLEKRFKKCKLRLNYYNPEIHFSSKVLPQYLKNVLNKKK